ncbi:MAG TPA: dihydroorotate dehydrogenase [Candidatus Nanoarchaeia archaeon]|nr:dihydroorotate dehydrogenase [Candidatus Nanoarchaeia archaeon]
MPSLALEITGLKLENPIILAAGVLGTTGSSLKRMADSGAGAVVTKSIGSEPKEGHQNPTMVKLDCGFLNAMGLPNPSYKDFQDELATAKQGGIPVVASVFGAHPDEFAKIIIGLQGADAYELNVSCPHATGYGAVVGTDPVLVEEITRAAKKATKAPVWVKLTPNVTDIVVIGEAAQKGGADAVVAINTVRGMAVDIHSGYPILGNIYGGLSGQAIRPMAVKCVFDLYNALDIPIIGVGGVGNWQDAVEMMMAGASAVQIGSAVYDDINIFNKICTGLSGYLSDKNYTLHDIIGLAHRRLDQ